MNSPQKTLTHTYDGKLKTIKLQLQDDILRASTIPKSEKLSCLGILRLELQKYPFPPEASRCFEAIYKTFLQVGRARGPNYDPTNDMYADDLLYLCYEKAIGNSEFTESLILQLVDMESGLCPQGRVIRLFQILMAF